MRVGARVGDVLLIVALVLLAIASVHQLRIDAATGRSPHDQPVASAPAARPS